MKKYQYQLLRYIHDRVSSEFVNIGIVVFEPETLFLKSKFISRYGRISQFFAEINGNFLMASIRQFERQVERVSNTTGDLFFNSKNISEITNSILPRDNNVLEFSEVFFGIDINPQAALEDLFERLVNRYIGEPEKDNLDDKHVWKKIYKEYFDKYGITKTLRPHSVNTANDSMVFDKSWKNGVWHCYQAVSFDLQRPEAIKNKVYKWSGILNELESANEELHLHFLTLSPKRHKDISQFIEDTLLNRNKTNVKVSLISEKNAESYVRHLSKEITQHQS